MSKKIALFCALLALIMVPAYAEVQNIKVSGDIAAIGLYRDNYDLEDEGWINPLGLALVPSVKNAATEDEDSLFVSIARLRVDADLTDNVAASVRIANLREWDVADAGADEILIDLANITLREMLYSPLTVVIGRQELLYGSGFILGPGRFQDPNAVNTYDDLSPLHGYDAIKAILDYDPWTIDLLVAKMRESDDDADQDVAGADTGAGQDSDEDLYGVNLGYKFDKYSAEMEGYLFTKREEDWNAVIDTPLADGNVTYRRTYEENDVYTVGLRGSAVPIENLTLGAEIAGQFGKIKDDTSAAVTAAGVVTVDGLDIGGDTSLSQERDRQAMLAYAMANYDFAKVRFTPALSAEYLYLSGEEAGQTGDFEDWDLMYRSRFMGTIRDTLETLFSTNDNLDTSGWTNQHTVKVKGSLDLSELVDGLNLDLGYLHYWFAEEPLPGANDDIGDEVILKATYDYTEDVQFALDSAWFIPGDYYDRVSAGSALKGLRGTAATNRVTNDPAVSIIGSCKVIF